MRIGDVYGHDHENLAEEFAWRTVQHSLGPLLTVIESMPGSSRNHRTRMAGV